MWLTRYAQVRAWGEYPGSHYGKWTLLDRVPRLIWGGSMVEGRKMAMCWEGSDPLHLVFGG